ncbi:MAG: hypothetical protein RLZZ611_1874 [Cyanobacteriota bacterium]|jgi:hypothetical protein
MLIEQLDYNLLFRWFVGFKPDDPVWHPTTFTKNRDRLLNKQLMAKFLELLLAALEVKPLLSSEPFGWHPAAGLGVAELSGADRWG